MPSSIASDSLPRVLGVLIARNEWPLLGISITHAMVNHVDELIVVDHDSTDETQAGLAALQKRWGKKIQVLHMCEGTFHHEETNLMLKTLYEDRDFDWIYPIDADEFLITPNDVSLKQLLSQVPESIKVVRYELHNFVAPSDFVENNFSRYSELNEKAVVIPDFQLTHETIFETVLSGELSFFDIPFDSKVMFRLPQDSWAIGGSHFILGVERESEFKFLEEETFVAHLPFLTRERLVRRAQRGRTLVNTGYTRDHGWQSQVVDQMHLEGRLDEYWQNNSIPNDSSDSQLSTPRTVTDQRLSPVLEAAITEMLSALDPIVELSPNLQPQCKTEITVSQGIQAIRAMALLKQKQIDETTSQLSEAHARLAQSASKMKTQQIQFQELIARYLEENNQILNSVSWRWTRGLRLTHRVIRAAAKKFARQLVRIERRHTHYANKLWMKYCLEPRMKTGNRDK